MRTPNEGDAEKQSPGTEAACKYLDDYRSSRHLPLLTDPYEDRLFRRQEREFLAGRLLGSELGVKPLDVRLRWRTYSEGLLLCADDLPEELAQRVAAVAYSKYVPLWRRSTMFDIPSAEAPPRSSTMTDDSACDGAFAYSLGASGPSADESSFRVSLASRDGYRSWVEVRYDFEAWIEQKTLHLKLTFADEPHLVMAELLVGGAVRGVYPVRLDSARRRRGSLCLLLDRLGSREVGIRIRDVHWEDWLEERVAAPFHINDVEAHVVSALRSREAYPAGGVSFVFCRKEGEAELLSQQLANGVWTIRVRENSIFVRGKTR